MDLLVTALIGGLVGGGLGYLVGQRRLVLPAVPQPTPAGPVASTFCQIRIIGTRAYHSYCPGRPRFDAFTMPSPGGIMKETGHWVAR